jgi:uncharacterized protein YceK
VKGKRKFTVGLITVALAAVLLLSGCVTIRSEVTVNPDLSGTRTIIMAIDQSMMDMAMEEGGEAEDPFADIESEFVDVPGAVVQPYTDQATGNQGVKISVPFKDLDDLASQKFSDEDEGLDAVTWTQDGDVYTLNFAVDTSGIAGGASGEDPEDMTPEDEAMAAQMMASMGLAISYSIALPGAILDYSPTEGATYDAENNAILWTLDMTNPSASSNIMVKWDNSAAPAPVDAPVAQQPVAGVAAAAPQTVAAEAQAYADAITDQDRDAYVALMAGGEMIPHPLMSDFPSLFQGADYKIVYDTVFADPTMGTAQWTGTWTVDGNTYTLAGVDVLTFDSDGKITAIEAFVVPSEFMALQGVVQ